MFNGKLMICAAALMFGLSGCMTMPDGSSKPDTEMIEFGSVAVFTVIVNETEVSDAAVVRAYEGLSSVEQFLQNVGDTGGDLDLSVIDEMLAKAVPIEYRALATSGSKLIRSRVARYMEGKLPENPITESEAVTSISLAVVSGARAALAPKYFSITK